MAVTAGRMPLISHILLVSWLCTWKNCAANLTSRALLLIVHNKSILDTSSPPSRTDHSSVMHIINAKSTHGYDDGIPSHTLSSFAAPSCVWRNRCAQILRQFVFKHRDQLGPNREGPTGDLLEDDFGYITSPCGSKA